MSDNRIDWSAGNIHELWYEFREFIAKKFGEEKEYPEDLKEKLDFDDETRLDIKWEEVCGIEALDDVREFAENNDVVEIRCDDDHHAGSRIFLVPHENEDYYWGTTVINIPQCSSNRGNMFLYPDHLDNYIEELQRIQRRQRNKNITKENNIRVWQEKQFGDEHWEAEVFVDGERKWSCGKTRQEAVNNLFEDE